MKHRNALVVAFATLLLTGCGNADTLGEGFVTVQGLAAGQGVVCGQAGGQGTGGPTISILGSGFLSEHGVDVTVIFAATTGTPFDGGTAAMAEVPAVVETDRLIISDVPSLVGTAVVTIQVILPGGNDAISVPGTLTIGGFLDGPFAFSDSYATAFQTQLDVLANMGPLVNDFGRQCLPEENEPVPGTLPPSVTGFTIVTYDSTTVGGGSVVMQSDGAFTYVPLAGYSGTDQFNYTMDDSGFQSSATVFISVSD